MYNKEVWLGIQHADENKDVSWNSVLVDEPVPKVERRSAR